MLFYFHFPIESPQNVTRGMEKSPEANRKRVRNSLNIDKNENNKDIYIGEKKGRE